jgi:uncharacterized protein YjbJ (UPF0337 family)
VKESTKDRAKVKSHDAKGKRKQKVAHAPANHERKAEDRSKNEAGNIQNEIGEAEDFDSEEDL